MSEWSISKKIRSLRKEKGLTQKELSRKSGIAEITIRQYEAGKYNPKPDAVMKLCIGLDCNVTDLIDKEHQKYYRIFDNIPADSNHETIYINTSIDETHPYNIIQKKIDNGEKLTQEERTYFAKYTKDAVFSFKQSLETFVETIKNNYSQYYELLNDAGKTEADKQINKVLERATEQAKTQITEQIEMLSKIPEYQKDPQTKTAAPEREPQDGETDTQ